MRQAILAVAALVAAVQLVSILLRGSPLHTYLYRKAGEKFCAVQIPDVLQVKPLMRLVWHGLAHDTALSCGLTGTEEDNEHAAASQPVASYQTSRVGNGCQAFTSVAGRYASPVRSRWRMK